ncbi:MAG: hypothetical protein MJ211_02840 [Bacteroidales bacterium]|nr:hypothetical protein [Bacteroidales bacterium]
MKDISVSHSAMKESLLSTLVNNSDAKAQKNVNIKVSLLNNGKVLPLPIGFEISDFVNSLDNFLKDNLKFKTELNSECDLYTITYYKLLSVMFKKTIVFMMIHDRLYINIVPQKYLEDANYSEGTISELLTGGQNEDIFQFIEDYILALYPNDVKVNVTLSQRYFEANNVGVNAIMAYHLEPNEYILARLNIYKIEKSKGNASTDVSDNSFYVLTTNGAYLFCLDKNIQVKYTETLSLEKMEVKSRIGRDTIVCGTTSWISNRDNDYLYDDIKEFNNAQRIDKILGFSYLNYNFAENNSNVLYSFDLLKKYSDENLDSFYGFISDIIILKTHDNYPNQIDDNIANKAYSLLIDSLNKDDFYKKTELVFKNFNFSAFEYAAFIYFICNIPVPENLIEQIIKSLNLAKEKYFKLDEDELNRALVELLISKKVLLLKDNKLAFKFASSAQDRLTDDTFINLAPLTSINPSSPCLGNVLKYISSQILFSSNTNEKDSSKLALIKSQQRPLDFNNIKTLLSFVDNSLIERVNQVLTIFDKEQFNSQQIFSEQLEIKNTINKIGETNFYHPAMCKKMPYADIKTWISKVQPENFDNIKNFGEKVSENNYPLLIKAVKNIAEFFEMEVPEVHVYKGEKSTGIFSYEGTKPFLTVGYDHLDINSPKYLTINELYFLLSRQFANISFGYSRLEVNKMWRDFYNSGAMNIDKLNAIIPATSYISKSASSYNKFNYISKVFSETPILETLEKDSNDNISKSLQKLLSIIHYSSKELENNIKEKEYSAISRLMCQTIDRVGLVFAGDFITAVNAILKSDVDITDFIELSKENSIFEIATMADSNGKYKNFDFALRLSSLISFYFSTSYLSLKNQIFK